MSDVAELTGSFSELYYACAVALDVLRKKHDDTSIDVAIDILASALARVEDA